MPITFIEPKRRKYYLILLVIAVVIGVLFLVWNLFFLRAPVSVVSKPSPPQEIKINFEILKNPLLEKLQPFEYIPLFEGKPGRENPFTPY
jgi:hypothetical protein